MKLNELKLNDNNPRSIKTDKFEKLRKSIREFPDMLEVRPIVALRDGTILGGNMRYRALIAEGYSDIPDSWVKFFDNADKAQEFLIKDNVGFGEWDWDMLANQWDVEQLVEWGLNIPNYDTDDSEAGKQSPKPILTIEFITTADLKEFTNAIQEILPDGSFIR